MQFVLFEKRSVCILCHKEGITASHHRLHTVCWISSLYFPPRLIITKCERKNRRRSSIILKCVPKLAHPSIFTLFHENTSSLTILRIFQEFAIKNIKHCYCLPYFFSSQGEKVGVTVSTFWYVTSKKSIYDLASDQWSRKTTHSLTPNCLDTTRLKQNRT